MERPRWWDGALWFRSYTPGGYDGYRMDVLSMIASGLGVPLADLCPRADAAIRVELDLFTEADALTLVRAIRRHLRPKPKEES